MLRELEIPLNPQQGFLGKKEAFGKSTCQRGVRDKAVPIISEIACRSCRRSLFELPAPSHLFEVRVNGGNWHVGLSS